MQGDFGQKFQKNAGNWINPHQQIRSRSCIKLTALICPFKTKAHSNTLHCSSNIILFLGKSVSPPATVRKQESLREVTDEKEDDAIVPASEKISALQPSECWHHYTFDL